MKAWNILYRGSLSSCNYDCGYCPFAKRRNTAAELELDAAQLGRFVEWVGRRTERIGVLFTPWGEALIYSAYQRAIVALSRMNHVRRVAIQTNLSGHIGWLAECDLKKTALWASWHPSQVRMARFLAQCRELDAMGARYSVGVVGRREAFDAIEQIRAALSPQVYLWVNAWKRDSGYYSEADLQRLEKTDPYFRLNTLRHPSRGLPCQAGHGAFAVDGDGQMRRCHFIPEVIGNIYKPGFERSLAPRHCTNETCGCHIGYVHLEPLNLYARFGEGILERIPDGWEAGQRGGLEGQLAGTRQM